MDMLRWIEFPVAVIDEAAQMTEGWTAMQESVRRWAEEQKAIFQKEQQAAREEQARLQLEAQQAVYINLY